jgi:hypothetical protein
MKDEIMAGLTCRWWIKHQFLKFRSPSKAPKLRGGIHLSHTFYSVVDVFNFIFYITLSALSESWGIYFIGPSL